LFEALYEIVLNQDEEFFHNTFKRSCYILINHWFAFRRYKVIGKLINILEKIEQIPPSVSEIVGCLRSWIGNFLKSEEYQELKFDFKAGKFATGKFASCPRAPRSARRCRPQQRQPPRHEFFGDGCATGEGNRAGRSPFFFS